jgi:hypothetical protein
LGFTLEELSFYLLGSTVFFNKDEGGIPHPDLWEKVVDQAFKGLVYENRQDLKQHCYGADRGRIVKQEDGNWVIYGTPGCEQFEIQLAKEFGLKEYRSDYQTDLHYKTVKLDVQAVKDSMRYFIFDQNSSLKFHSC